MTSPGAYSAGTAILDVIPVFRGVQDKIKREVRDIEKALGKEAGDELGKGVEKGLVSAVDRALNTTKAQAKKGGEEAAKEYAGRFSEEFGKTMGRVQREFKAMKFEVQPVGFDKLRKDIESLSKAKIGKDMDAGPALIELGRLETKLREIQDAASDVRFRADIGAALAEFETFRKRIQRDAHLKIEVEIEERQIGLFERALKKRISAALENFPPIEFDADVTPAQQKLMELRAEMQALGNKRIGVDIDGSAALAEMERLRVALATIANDETVNVQVRTEAAGAAAELLEIRTLAKLVDDTRVEIEPDVKVEKSLTALERLRNKLLGADDAGREGANGFRAFNAAILVGAMTLPAVIPALGALAGALALLGPLGLGAATGLIVLGTAFTGIGDAVSALGKVQDNAGKDAVAAARTMRTASEGVASAERSLASARENAGRAGEAAARRVSDAVDRQRDAERDLVRAQQDVVVAQEAVNRAREEARERIEDLQLSIRGGALAEREAILDLAAAQREFDAAMASGVEGEARERAIIDLEQAKLRVDMLKESNGDLAEEQAEVARTGVEGSREVVSAQEGVRRAQEGVQRAMEGVADASRGVEDALRDQQQTNADSARSIADAQLNLTQAQQAYSDAIFDTQVQGSASAQALELAMGKLGPAGREFAQFWFDLGPQFRALRDTVQAGLFPGLQEAISDILTTNGPLLQEFMGSLGTTLGDLFRQFGDMMTSPQWQGIWATFNEYAPTFLRLFGEAALAMLTFFGELFQALAPYSERFGEALVRLAVASAEWIAAFVDSQTFRDIMEWLFTNGPVIFGHLWSIAKGIGAIFISLLPLGMTILGMLGELGEWLADMDPEVLAIFSAAVIGLVVALQLAYGAVALVSGVFTVMTAPIAAVVLSIAAFVAGLIILYTQSEAARTIIDAVFRAIGEVISFVWNYIVVPVFEAMIWQWDNVARIILWVYENVWKPVFEGIGTVASWLWDNILEPIFTAIGTVWEALVTGIAWLWDTILRPVFDFFIGLAQVLYAIVVVAVLGPILAFWSLMVWGIKELWDTVLEPVWEQVKIGAQILWDWLQPIFSAIGTAWDAMALVLEAVYNGFIKPKVIDPFMIILDALKTAFETTVDAIGTAWGWLRETLAKPINWVIEYVLNKGLFAAFNWVIDTLGLPKDWQIDDFGLITIDGQVPRFAAGGRVPGYSPNDKADNIPAMLTAGEWVQPVAAVDYYGPEFMEAIRKRKIPRDVLQYFSSGGPVQRLATGGQIFELTRSVFPRAKLNSAYRPGDPGFHGSNQAADMGEAGFPGGRGRAYIGAMKRWWYDNFGRVANEIIYNGIGNAVPNVKDGKNFAYSALTQSQHLNHLHVALTRAISDMGAVGGPLGGGGMGGGSFTPDQPWWKDVFGTVTGVFTKIKDGISMIGEMASKFGDNKMVKIVSEVPGKMVDNVWAKVKDTVAALFEGLGQDDGKNAAVDAVIQQSGGVQNVVKAVAARYGWDKGAEWNALYTLVQKESSWNPNAQNPSSTAYGLFQFLNSTWAGTGVKKTADPAGQAQAGLKYIQGRYGSPSKALAFHRANNWYSEGGEVGTEGGNSDAPTLYDTGGWLPPGVTTVLNATNKPEPILTGQQWDELVAARDTEYDGGYGGINELHLHEVQADLSEAIGEVNHIARTLRRGGRYAGAGSR